MFTLRQYLEALGDSHGLWRTLHGVELCRDAAGRPLYTAGNSAAVFRVRIGGVAYALRCYFRPRRHLREIYGGRFLPQELYLHLTPSTGCRVDVVLCDWVEGETLDETLRKAVAASQRERLADLARRFDALGAALVSDDRAHGDLKPENIVVDPSGELHPIDFDGAYLPAFAGERSPELGTAAFQHPARTAEDFDERLDDYSVALLSAALHALALDPSLGLRYGARDGLLFSPGAKSTDPAFAEALTLFERAGDALHYRIALLLRSPSLRLPSLGALLGESVRRSTSPVPPCGEESRPELFVRDGLWGYRTPEGEPIPPLYDSGFDFTEGLAAVRLGSVWHYVDTAGRTVLSCPGCEAVKPFRGGRAVAVRQGRRIVIDRRGREC